MWLMMFRFILKNNKSLSVIAQWLIIRNTQGESVIAQWLGA